MKAKLPISNNPAQTFTTQLGARKFDFEVKFNSRSGVWSMDMADSVTGAALFQGVPLVLGTDLLEPYNYGAGSLVVVDTTGRGMEATADDMGSRVIVIWSDGV